MVSLGCTGRVALGINGLLKVGGLLVLSGLLRVHVGLEAESSTKLESFRVALEGCQSAFANGKPEKCKLFGKIQIVDSFPDVKVQVVESFPDIRVQKVSSFADSAGEWEMVEHFPDYKVQLVESFPDYKVQYVDSFPGCN